MSSFKDVVGHKNIIQYIENAVKTDKVSHAYILNGEKGSGKRLLANLFAMSLQCQNRDEDGDACGKCQSCKQAASNNQPDIIRVTHEKPNTISIDDIREQINNDIVIKPYSSKYKIYIVPDADMMSVQAQNALLKTIEEPPAYAVILLLTENAEILLPTIRSRCVMLKLRNIKDQLIKKYLMEQMEIPDYKADVCVAFAQGNMGRAIMLATSEHFNDHCDHNDQFRFPITSSHNNLLFLFRNPEPLFHFISKKHDSSVLSDRLMRLSSGSLFLAPPPSVFHRQHWNLTDRTVSFHSPDTGYDPDNPGLLLPSHFLLATARSTVATSPGAFRRMHRLWELHPKMPGSMVFSIAFFPIGLDSFSDPGLPVPPSIQWFQPIAEAGQSR